MRLVFNQALSWGDVDVYSMKHCCYCGKELKGKFSLLCLSRTNDGEWWACDSKSEESDEKDYGRFVLPIGNGCLKNHPEFKFAVVKDKKVRRG